MPRRAAPRARGALIIPVARLNDLRAVHDVAKRADLLAELVASLGAGTIAEVQGATEEVSFAGAPVSASHAGMLSMTSLPRPAPPCARS